MNASIQEYMKQVKALFPLWGKAEQQYWQGLAASLENHFAECPPTCMDEILDSFDPPQEVVREYLSHTDICCTVRRARNHKLFKRVTFTALVVVLLGTITFSVCLGLYYNTQRSAIEAEFSIYTQGE